MLIRKKQATREQIAKKGIAFDYPTGESLGIAMLDLDGRVPDYGRQKNKICYEIIYVISGKGTVFIDNEKYEVGCEDVFDIKPNQKSHIIADKLRILTVTVPNWYPEQCETVEE